VQEIVASQKEELGRQQQRAEKELSLCETGLNESAIRIDEANKAALDGRAALAIKESELKATKERTSEELRALEAQEVQDAATTLQSFANKRTVIESLFIRATEEVKEEMDRERESLLMVRDQIVSAAKDEATKARILLDREYQNQEETLKAVYQEVKKW
jgi:hypothetical protein